MAFIDFPELVFKELAREATAMISLFMVLVLCKRYVLSWFRLVERRLSQIGKRKTLSLVTIAILAMGVSCALSVFGKIPYPRIHDEFSYLLAADTFARGRLTNPPHPLWPHFESMHILQQPTYASKYPPAQGLILALGQVVGGHPIVGVWISTALACASVLWMLLAWVPPRWALLGALIVLFHPGVLLSWGQSYWGGNVAVIGGALLFGGFRRLLRHPSVGNALWASAGLAILANSRPYEGLVAALPVAVALLAWMAGGEKPPFHLAIKRVILPIAFVLASTAGMMGIYNSQVTGHPLQMPYIVHEASYAIAPFLLWQSPRPVPEYRHEILRFHHFRGFAYYAKQQSLRGVAEATLEKTKMLWKFYQGSRGIRLSLTLPLIVLPWLWKNRSMRFPMLVCAFVVAGLLMETWGNAHYAAPIAPLVCLLMISALRQIYSWRRYAPFEGRLIAWSFLIVILASFVVDDLSYIRNHSNKPSTDRPFIMKQLGDGDDRHLIIVPQGPLHPNYGKRPQEWVYNEADIDGARVVWARELAPSQNWQLLQHFKDRKAWLLANSDSDMVPRLVPYRLQ